MITLLAGSFSRPLYLRVHSASKVARLGRFPRRVEPQLGRRTFAVVGGGLSGLAAAWRISRAGHDVRVFEARDRPGGRVLTLHYPMSSSWPIEVGPARFRDDHFQVLSYLKRFSLDYSPFYPRCGTVVASVGGSPVFRGPMGTQRGWRVTGRPYDDATSVLGFYREISPLFGVGRESRPWHRARLYKIRDGADGLTAALVRELGPAVTYQSPVAAIHQNGDRVSIQTHGTSERTHEFDRVICCVPPTTLGHIEFSPPLSQMKRDALQQFRFESAIRIFLRVRERGWRRQGLCGFGFADDLGEIWDSLHDRDQRGTVLTVYAKGSLAREMMELDPQERVARVLGQLERVLPGVAGDVEDAQSFCWDDEPWSRGGWPVFSPRASGASRHHAIETLASPAGRVHFAGDHTSPQWFAWMEGALESGHRAADELLTSIPQSHRIREQGHAD